jgi:Concanavalin A-like lectin/glucanases superfamily/PEP-CTERM motif
MKSPLRIAASLLIVGIFLPVTTVVGQTTSFNSGSLGAAGNGTNSAGVVLNLPGPILADGNTAVGYSGGERTLVPFQLALNPVATSSFTIEFWARPTASDNDDAALSNRFATGNRSGWTFFQRDQATGWNFRMYNGNLGALGWDLTGGTATLDAWSHVVATWNGSAALLYVNGILADSTNDPGANGIYNPNTAVNSPPMSIGANFDGGSPSTSSMDEVAFYATALTPAQIANHFSTASSPVAGAYSSLVLSDGAVEYLQNIPEPSSAGLVAAGAALFATMRRRQR